MPSSLALSPKAVSPKLGARVLVAPLGDDAGVAFNCDSTCPTARRKRGAICADLPASLNAASMELRLGPRARALFLSEPQPTVIVANNAKKTFINRILKFPSQ